MKSEEKHKLNMPFKESKMSHKKYSMPDIQKDVRMSRALESTFSRGLLLKSPIQLEAESIHDHGMDFQEAINTHFNYFYKNFLAQSTLELQTAPYKCKGDFCALQIIIPEDLRKLKLIYFAPLSIIMLGKNVFFTPLNDLNLKGIHPMLLHSLRALYRKQLCFESKIKSIVKIMVGPQGLTKMPYATQFHSGCPSSSKNDIKGKLAPICTNCLIVYINIHCKTSNSFK